MIWHIADGDPVKVRDIDERCTIEDVLDAWEYRQVKGDLMRQDELRRQGRPKDV